MAKPKAPKFRVWMRIADAEIFMAVSLTPRSWAVGRLDRITSRPDHKRKDYIDLGPL